MFKLVILMGFLYSCSCMSLSAESSKRMTLTSPDGARKMYIEHASKSDLEGSASGYIYRSDGRGPASYVELGEPHYVEPQDFTHFVNQGYETFLHPVKFENLESGEYFGRGGYGGEGNVFDGNKGFYYKGGEESYGGEEKGKYSNEKGHHSNEEFYHSGGEKGGKGYKDYDEFNKELKKKLNDNEEEAFHKQAGGGKKNHYEEDEKYEDVKDEKKGEEGENFSSKKSHKKGHKTTGFHNVYHKDEFKKQHSFFDEADDDGHHSKFGANHEAHGAEGGDYKKEGHLNAGHHNDEYHKKGDFHKGDFESAAKGFRESEGGKKFYENNAEYGNKGGKSFHKNYGYEGHSAEHGGEY